MLKDFMKDKVWIVAILDGDSPATALGLSGEYYLLDYNAWNCFGNESIYEEMEKADGKPKDIVIMKDGNISKHHFDDKMGVYISLKKVSTDELADIKRQYQKWKVAR